MKILSRDFTLKEKIMLLVLGLIILGLAYYRFVHIPCKEAIEAAHAERDAYQTELLAATAKEGQLRRMKEELDSLGELQYASRMDSYNNSKAELSMLNNVLEGANDYSITFSGVTRNGDQIRRNFTLVFETEDFATAKRLVDQLSKSEYRCLLGDMQYSFVSRRLSERERELANRRVGDVAYLDVVRMTVTGTFYETMYDGVADAGLPAEK